MPFRGYTGGTVNGGPSTITVTKPTGVQEGDWLLVAIFAIFSFGSGSGITPPTGWTQVNSYPLGGDPGTTDFGTIFFARQMGASEPSSWNFTAPAGDIENWVCGAWYGIGGFDTVWGEASGFATAFVAPSVTIGTAGSRVATFAIVQNCPTTTPVPSGMTNRARVEPFGDRALLFYDDNATSGAGSSGTRSAAVDPGNWDAINFLLLPGGGGGPISLNSAGTSTPTAEAIAHNFPVGVWTDISPAGVYTPDTATTQGVTVSPHDPNLILLCSLNGGTEGLYRSTNGGYSWTKIPPFDAPVKAVWHPTNPNRVYLVDGVGGSTEGCWRSDDAGLTWALCGNFASVAEIFDCYHIEMDPGDSNHLLVTYHNSPGQIARSTDGGDTWTSVQLPSSGAVGGYGHNIFILRNPALGLGSSSRWLLMTQGAGTWLTTNAGTSWTQVYSTHSMGHGGTQIVWSDSGTIYLGGDDGLIKSTDLGASWTFIDPGSAAQINYLALERVGQKMYTAKQQGANGIIGANFASDTSWSQLGAENFVNSTGSGGPFQLKYYGSTLRLYGAMHGLGLWVYQFAEDATSGAWVRGAVRSGSPQIVVASAPHASRYAARSGSVAEAAQVAQAAARARFLSGASLDFASVTAAPAGVRSLAKSGANAESLFLQLAGAGSRAAAGASLEAAAFAPSGARSAARVGVAVPASFAQPAGARSGAKPGAGSELPQLLPAGVRTLSRAGAAADFPATAPAGSRASAVSGACTPAPFSLGVGVRLSASSGAASESAGVVAAPAAVRSLARSGANQDALFTSAAAARGLAASGACSELSGVIAAPSASRSLARSGACVGAASYTQAGCRASSPAGASAAVAFVAPATAARLLPGGSSLASPSLTFAASRTASRGGATLGLTFTSLSTSRVLSASGASSDSTVSVISPAGVRSLARSGAVVQSAFTAVTVSAQAARSGQGVSLPVVAFTASRPLALSGAPVDVAAAFVTSSAGVRSLASSGANRLLAALTVTSASAARTLARSGAFVSVGDAVFLMVGDDETILIAPPNDTVELR